jgi:hypothetical protein
MRSRFQVSIPACLLLIALCSSPSFAQNILELFPERDKEWRRVSTETDAVIHVNTGSLVLESNGRIRATFRFRLGKKEKAVEKAGAYYKTRLETIQFDTREQTYRFIETTLLDGDGKIVYASGPVTTRSWKPIAGRTVAQFYNVAVELPPLGAWTVVAARYPDGTTPPLDNNPPNAPPLVSSRVNTRVNQFGVGRNSCKTPSYESTSFRGDEFAKWTGFTLQDAGISTEKVDAIKIKCETGDRISEIHVLLIASVARAKLLSGGVLLDLEKLDY